MAKEPKKEQYTYSMMVDDLLTYLPNCENIPPAKRIALFDKVSALGESYAKRAEYAKTHKKPSKAKGPGAETLVRAEQIKAILTDSPATTAEINQILGTDFSALQVANATKYIEGVHSSKVIREVVDKNGLHVERQYTAYFIG